MNDPLKTLIDRKRDDLDHLEPPADILFRIRTELKKDRSKKGNSVVKLAFGHKWLIAASVLVLLSAVYLVFHNQNTGLMIKRELAIVDKKTNDKLQQSLEDKPKYVQVNRLSLRKKSGTKHAVIDLATIYADLQDSTSSSTRLAAILKIGQSGFFDYRTADRLAKTLDADDNSNVRLAALSLLERHSEDSYISGIFLKALETQRDPAVQIGLIELLSRKDNLKLDDRLYALANDPNTFTAVRDEAYQVLLNQNKL